MEKLISCWSDGKKLPENYVFPPDERPGKHVIPLSKSIPVIDLGVAEGDNHKIIVQQIMEATLEFGFFQVINHGVPRILMDDARSVFKEFFELPGEEKSKLISFDFERKCALYASNIEYEREEIHLWKDTLKLSCTPLKECLEYWPQNPTNFREITEEYVVKVTNLGSRILEMLSQGLGLESGYFDKGLSEKSRLLVHHYPACPDPSLTLGTATHCDFSPISILLQDNVPGLQLLKEGKWIGVEPIPDALVINMGQVVQIVSNGKLRSVEHRVVTNDIEARTSAAFFLHPAENCVVQPAEAVITAENPPIYKTIQYRDLFRNFREAYRGKNDHVLENFIIKT